MPELLEIRLLGPFEVLVSGTVADVGGSKRQALLAMLALRAGRVVAVDMLIDGLWGADLPSAPRNALHHHIARLRAALGEESIVGSSDGYALQDAHVDAARFEELLAETRAALRDGDVVAGADAVDAALALWRGQALQGLTGTAWFSAEARRLESLRVDALEERFEVALALGEHRELPPPLRSALADNPFRERLWGQLMLSLYRSGRQADALETFQEARRVLADELGLEPGPDLRRLQEAILAHDPAIAAVPVDRRRRGNLPALSTSFIGREEALDQITALLHEHRLVTLTGPPGVGKSRLAVETARSLEREFPEGAWLVDFARAAGAADAVRLLANAVDVRGSDPLARVVSRLRHASALVVLDACEHVLEEAARIVSTILAECPGVRIVATSREALHVASEVRVPVSPLGVAAVDLFLERARAARPGFAADDETVALATEIARRVDGLPLALELAAARTNVLGLAELVSILDRREALLQDGPIADPSRTALRELVEWSYDLLHGDEKTLLQQLAVHRGGASLASLVAVGAAHDLNEATVAYLVAALVDKSIVFASFSSGAARYDMLDSVREYVLGRLSESGDLAAAHAAHAAYFAELAAEAGVELRGPEWLRWESHLQVENDNFWAALSYAREAVDAGLAARLGSLGLHFALGERISEGRRFLELALTTSGEDAPIELRIEQLAVLCYLTTEELDLPAAVAAGEQALALAATAEAPRELGLAQLALALALAQSGKAEEADALGRDALATLESTGDEWGSATAGIIRATGAAAAGDVATVAEMATSIQRHADAIDYDAFRVPGLLLEAWVAERRDDPVAAVEGYRRALELSGRIGFGDHAAFALAGLGANALASGDLHGAEELQRQALATAEAAHATWAASHARLQLARIAAAAGDPAAAARLYQQVLEWSQTERPHEARESLFLALAGSPATAAELGLAELGETALT
ncbi:MAG TPA: BTAD domain-containing putative transcriptional regulator [Gaiellaceae bacterium]|nr:BTAD domain-containing putative transcriptional regulator [Gaiellaceae bacterium]